MYLCKCITTDDSTLMPGVLDDTVKLIDVDETLSVFNNYD